MNRKHEPAAAARQFHFSALASEPGSWHIRFIGLERSAVVEQTNDDIDMEQVEEQDGVAGSGARVPPYVAYSTFLTLLKELKDNGIPPQLDKSVLRRFAFGVQGQLKMALRSLGMLEGDKPTPRLKAFVDAHETDQFASLLLPVLQEVYPYVFALDLKTATPTMFGDTFKQQSGAKGEDGLRKCRSFFMHAAKAAGVEFGPRLASGSVPRSSNGGARRKPKTKTKDNGGGAETPTPTPTPATQSDTGILSQLLGKFPDFDPTWPDEIKAKWFAGFDQFMKGAKPK